ncbi:MAG: major facilitator superfamily transport protein [Bacteroidetes bacterium]|jgi:MFS family permease|nr:major facilitator superfamily transport protein [Bacteroidota bacterium]
MEQKTSSSLNKLILVAALGYFVDIYDLLLFSVERIDSLVDILKVDAKHPSIKSVGMDLLNWQMFGMLIGGIFWGILGDKKGRLSVLFGSIITYSLANIANGFVQDVNTYSVLRFVSGFGLAGELGAGITLVSESMSKERRGIGTMIVATVGVFGAVVAGFMGGVISNWRVSFFIGGGMGLLLLILRIGVLESSMFKNVKESKVRKGNFFLLFSSAKQIRKYLAIIFVAVPVWYVMGILISFSPDIIGKINPAIMPNPGTSIMFAYLGITVGDVASGLISQLLKSRKKALFVFLTLTLISIIMYFTVATISIVAFYSVVTFIGFATGYWAVFMSSAAELFGTNIRATATTTAPNFVRGAVIPISFGFKSLEKLFVNSDGTADSVTAAIVVGAIVLVVAYISLYSLEETFHKDLNYTENE